MATKRPRSHDLNHDYVDVIIDPPVNSPMVKEKKCEAHMVVRR